MLVELQRRRRARCSCSGATCRRRASCRSTRSSRAISSSSATQDALVRSYIAHARMEQHFRPNDDRSRLRRRRPRTATSSSGDGRRVGGAVVLGQRHEVGPGPAAVSAAAAREGAVAAAAAALRQRLPLPARRHRARRRLRLLRRALRAGRAATQSLYRGTVWIDRRTFARVKVQAVQTRCRRRSVSNEEIQTYAPVDVDRQPAGLPLQRPDRAADHADRRPQPAGREERGVPRLPRQRRTASRARATRRARSDRIMYRETDRGLRYYVKEGANRVVSDRPTQSAQAMAMGVDDRSVLRLSAADPRHQLSELRVRRPQLAAGHPVRRRARGGQHPAPEARADAVRRQRRLLRDCRAVERSRLRRGRRARAGAPADLAAVDRPQSRLAGTRRSRS